MFTNTPAPNFQSSIHLVLIQSMQPVNKMKHSLFITNGHQFVGHSHNRRPRSLVLSATPICIFVKHVTYGDLRNTKNKFVCYRMPSCLSQIFPSVPMCGGLIKRTKAKMLRVSGKNPCGKHCSLASICTAKRRQSIDSRMVNGPYVCQRTVESIT